MIELTKFDVQKMASDILKVSPELLDVELEYAFWHNGSLFGNGSRFPSVFRGDDMKLFYVVGGWASSFYTPNALDDLPLYAGVPLALGVGPSSAPLPVRLSDLSKGGFFCSSLDFGERLDYSFSVMYYRISVI